MGVNVEEIQTVVRGELAELGDSPGNRREILRLINNIENELKVKTDNTYWSPKNAESEIHRLNEVLGESEITDLKSIIDAERRTILKQIEAESTEQEDLKKTLRSELSTGQAKIIDRHPGQDFVQRSVAVANHSKRNTIRDDFLNALDELRSQALISNFKPKDAKTTFQDGSHKEVRKYAKEFAWYLETKGWDQDDIKNVGKQFSKTDEPLHEFIVDVSTQSTHTYQVITFVESVSLTGESKSFDDDSWTIYPAGTLNVSQLPSAQALSKPQIEGFIEDYCSIKLTVSAYGVEGADKKAAERVAEFLDGCSFVTDGDLIEPQHRNRWPRILWNLKTGKEHSKISFSNHLPATLDPDHLDKVVDILSLASIGPGHGTGLQLSTTTAGAASAALQTDTQRNKQPLSQRLARGLHFYRRSTLPTPNIDTVINQIACLETLASQGKSRRNSIINRSMTLSGVHDAHEDEYIAAVKELYMLRNAALHSGFLGSSSWPRIEWAQNKTQTHLRHILSVIDWYVDMGSNGNIEDLTTRQNRFLDCRYQAIHWELEQDDISTGTNYQLQGQIFTSEKDHFADITGTIRVTDVPERSIKVVCDCQIENRSRPAISGRTRLRLHVNFDGVTWVLEKSNPWPLVTENQPTLEFNDFERIDGQSSQ